MSAIPIIVFIVGALLLFVIGLWSSRRSRIIDKLESLPPADRQRALDGELEYHSGDSLIRRKRKNLSIAQLKQHEKRVRLMMQSVVSIVLLGASLYVILQSSFSAQDKHWAFGTIGTIIGFWLKG